VAKIFKKGTDNLIHKRSVLETLEIALGSDKLAELKEETDQAGGSSQLT